MKKKSYNEAWLWVNGQLHFRLPLYQSSNLIKDGDVCAQVKGKREGMNICVFSWYSISYLSSYRLQKQESFKIQFDFKPSNK